MVIFHGFDDIKSPFGSNQHNTYKGIETALEDFTENINTVQINIIPTKGLKLLRLEENPSAKIV